jgi:hypothetical protein
VNYNNSFNPNPSPSTSSNQLLPDDALLNPLRDTLLQYITPEDVAKAQARAEAILASQSEEESPHPRKKSRPASHKRSRRAANSDALLSETERHSRKCSICQREDRAEIEQFFMHWVPLMDIADEFDLPSADAVRRHAIAMGLEAARNQTMRRSLHRIIERAGDATPTATGVIQAIRACSSFDDSGRWVEPPRRVIFTHEVRYIESHAAQPPAAPANDLPAPSATVPRPLPASALEEK